MSCVDLHVHTNASDGSFTPTDLIKKAKRLGLKALGITDHDTVAGIEEAIRVGNTYGVEIVPGCELSVLKEEKEIHILGYYINYRSLELRSILEEFRKEREKRGGRIVEKLQTLGFEVNFKKVKELAGVSLGRPHIASAVIGNPANQERLKKEFGEIPTSSDFIGSYLVEGKVAYVSRKFFSSKEVVALIEKHKGISVLAHPGFSLPEERESWLKDFVAEGLDGLEVYHYKEDDETTKEEISRLKRLAKKYSLIETGGSDYHNPRNEVGAPLGFEGKFLKAPYVLVEKMNTYRRQKYT